MRIQGGLPQYAELQAGAVGEGLAIALTEPPDSLAAWTIDVDVATNEGRFRLGRVVSRAPRAGDPTARVVAVAHCPGAVGWVVAVNGPPGAAAELVLASSKTAAAAVGVVAIRH